MCVIHPPDFCIRVYARRPSFLYFPNWIALSAFRSLTLSSSHQGPTDSPAVPMSHTPARLRTSFTLTPRRSSPGGSRKNCIHTRAIRWTPPSFYATLFRAYLWLSFHLHLDTPKNLNNFLFKIPLKFVYPGSWRRRRRPPWRRQTPSQIRSRHFVGVLPGKISNKKIHK
jgi:hypothetical protein